MKLLLDTNALIWLLKGDEHLGHGARAAINDESNTVFVSAISIYEMAVKIRIGKLTLDVASVIEKIDESDIERMGIEDRHCLVMANIKAVPGHRDPFDLMLVAQAISDGLTIVSGDHKLNDYPVKVMAC